MKLSDFESLQAAEKFATEQSQKYYSNGDNDITDADFDELIEEIRQVNPNSPVLNIGHGYSVTSDSTPGEKCTHKYGIAGSLAKCRTWKELDDVFKKGDVDVSLKMDGLSVVLYYENDLLVKAITRGDGHIGIDITDKVTPYIIGNGCAPIYPETTPANLCDPFTGAVRGEIIMSFANFERFKQDHPEAKNPRNSAAGLINSKDATDELRYLDIIVYTIVGDESMKDEFDDIVDIETMYDWLTARFTHVVPHQFRLLQESTFLDVMTQVNDQFPHDYPSDGLVIKYPISEGDMQTYEIKYTAQAFKFKSETANAKVVDVIWNMSKTRYAVPLVLLEPVQLAGTTVCKCTGYNAQYIQENQIGPGAIVEVEKRGEIIPNINKVITPSTSCSMPTNCPECGTELIWNGVFLQCPNTDCVGSQLKDVVIWFQTLVPTDGLGDKLLIKFLTEIYGTDNLTVDLVMNGKLREYISVSPLAPAQLKLFSKAIASLYQSTFSLESALKALNIPRIGDITASKLAQYPDLTKDLYDMVMNPPKAMEDKSSLIGDANWRSILNNIDKFKRWSYIIDQINFQTASPVESKGKVAITGKLSVKRADFEKELRAAGYNPSEIAKDTKFLITDDPSSSSSKNKKADQWGITKITELEFRLKYLNQS